MRSILATAALTILTSFGVFAQSSEAESFIRKGVAMHDEGNFKGAVKQYEKALEVDKKSPLAHYEMALTYFAMKEYKDAIAHADDVLALKSEYMEEAYLVKGSSQDVMGKPDDAIKTYKKAIKRFPKSHLMHYNIALTYYNHEQPAEAEKSLEDALTINPNHASSHLMMGLLMSEQGSRVKSCLSLYYFLLIEPTGKRAKTAWTVLDQELKKGVKREGENTINISISPDGDSEFQAAELMLSMLEASKTIEKNEGKSEYQLFAENTKSFFSVLGELKDKNKGFWWTTYVDFFYEMVNKNHCEAFSYYVTQVREEAAISEWLDTHQTAVEDMAKWGNDYLSK